LETGEVHLSFVILGLDPRIHAGVVATSAAPRYLRLTAEGRKPDKATGFVARFR
jgi:hypothetical protein